MTLQSLRHTLQQLYTRTIIPSTLQTTTLRSFAACCSTALPLDLHPAQPGTVKSYDNHILLRVSSDTASPSSPPPQQPIKHSNSAESLLRSISWPPIIETHPAVVEAFRSLATAQAELGYETNTKITLFEPLTLTNALEKDRCDVMIYPAATMYNNLPLTLLPNVIAADVCGKPKALPAEAKQAQSRLVSTLTLLVCCHGSHDARCGFRGPPLATALAAEARKRGLSQQCNIYAVSHIGGHKYAGNVIVYMPSHSADGDWFGGLSADDAGAFLEALETMDFGVDGGAEDARLRKWWRGRLGVSRTLQREMYEAEGQVLEVGLEEIEGEEDWDEDGEGKQG